MDLPDQYPDIACVPPDNGEVGDQWFCPHCARKFQYVLITLEPSMTEAEAWFTDEIR